MSNGTLPFSDVDYDKLDRAVFPTIRRRDKYGDVPPQDFDEFEGGDSDE